MVELKYVPHAVARHLATRKTRVVGLLLGALRNDFFVPLLNGIEGVARSKGYNMTVATYSIESRKETLPPIGPHNTDGMLVFADGLFNEDLAHYVSIGFPIVLVHRASPSSLKNIPSVTIENSEITKNLIEHLIQVHGRKHILFMRGPFHQEDSGLREDGYRLALQTNGIPVDENLIIQGDFDRNVAYETLSKFLDTKNRPEFDAVFTGNDDAAIGALKALRQFGIQIPEQVSMAGFDDLDFAGFLNPPLTTVRAPIQSVGRIATERLFGLLEGQTIEGTMVLPTEIILRHSCGCEYLPQNLLRKEVLATTDSNKLVASFGNKKQNLP